MNRINPSFFKQKGFTLLETVMSIVALGFAATAFAIVLSSAKAEIFTAESSMQDLLKARSCMEEIAASYEKLLVDGSAWSTWLNSIDALCTAYSTVSKNKTYWDVSSSDSEIALGANSSTEAGSSSKYLNVTITCGDYSFSRYYGKPLN